MSTIVITKFYEHLSSSIGKENAENLTTFIESKIEEDLESKTQYLATKDELIGVKHSLELKISETKADLVKWMITLWLMTVLMILGLYFKS